MAHKKGPGLAGATEAKQREGCDPTVTQQHRYTRYNPALQLRYPLQAAADALALMRWDAAHAGGHHQLAEALHVHRSELLEHRWRLQVVAPIELEVAHAS